MNNNYTQNFIDEVKGALNKGSGEAAISPTVDVVEIDGGHQVSITDVNGSKSFIVMNGETGPKGDKGDTGIQGPQGETGPKGDKGDTGPAGADGKTPVKGTDYFTEEEKAEMVQEVIDAVNEGTTTE